MLTRTVAAQGAIFFDSDSFRRPFFFLLFRLVLSLIIYSLFLLLSLSLYLFLCMYGVIYPFLLFLYLSFSFSNLLFISPSFLFHPSLESPYIARFMFLESASLHHKYMQIPSRRRAN